MSHSSRRSKFQTKLSTKDIEKSSLPEIDPLHLLTIKHASNFALKHPAKTVKEKNHNNFSFTKNHFRPNDMQFVSHTDCQLQNQQHEQISHLTKLLDKTIAEKEKELMTADTIRPEHQSEKAVCQAEEAVSSGFDVWNLNKNLKQFSETRKLPFYKNQNHTINAPESTTQQPIKNRTQQIKSMYKIYGGDTNRMNITERERSEGHLTYKKQIQPLSKVKITQKDSKSYSTISNTKLISPLGNTLYGTLPVRRNNFNFDTIYSKKQLQKPHFHQDKSFEQTSSHLNPYLRTFVNGSHIKRQASNRNIHILQMNTLTAKQKINDPILNINEVKKPTNLRKNRFQMIQDPTTKNESNLQNQYSKSVESEASIDQMNEGKEKSNSSFSTEEYADFDQLRSSLPEKILFDKTSDKKKQLEYLRTIQKINKCMLRNSEDYLDQYSSLKTLPYSQIEFYINSLNHPEFVNQVHEYRSSYCGQTEEQDEYFLSKNRKAHQKQKSKKQIDSNKNKKQISKTRIN